MAFDSKGQRLLFLRSASSNLFEIRVDPQGIPLPGTLKPHNSNKLGIRDPQGMTFDPASGELFILDGDGPRLINITPNAEGDFAEAGVTEIDLGQAGLASPRGIAFDSTSGHLHIMSYLQQRIYEVTKAGVVVAVRDLTGLEISAPQGMVFAPSGDQTDDPLQMSLYLADSGQISAVNADSTKSVGELASGQIIELALTEAVVAEPASFVSSLVQTIDTSAWSPPSPDAAGITYMESSGMLLVVDSEVNEMPLYEGRNVFESTLLGDLNSTFDTTSFSDEPTGISLDDSDGHLFFSDDTGDRSVYELNPGDDGFLFSPDDIVTSFPTEVFGSTDPEGVTVASGLGVLFVADGLNEEVYKIAPGTNGTFDGVPPMGDDQVTSFDTTAMGLIDPEGITFNPNSGNLYIVGEPSGMLFEVTIAGSLVQTIDISAANAANPAGLTIAPSSHNPTVRNIYITARGVDNNSDPSENDGKVYELTLDLIPNIAPAVSAGPDQTISLQDIVFLDGSASDDGLPLIPGALSISWSQESGPGTVSFANSEEILTSATFSETGVLHFTLDSW